MDKQEKVDDEAQEFDFFLRWEWPTHIEESLRRMLWISLIEACEDGKIKQQHTTLLRHQIASYLESPAAVLDVLSMLDDQSLLIRIAENPKASSTTLIRLAQHEMPQVRVAVAENKNMPFAAMKILSEDESPDVCYSMAENYELPSSLLGKLAKHDNPYVAERAVRTLARRSQMKVKLFIQKDPQWRKAE